MLLLHRTTQIPISPATTTHRPRSEKNMAGRLASTSRRLCHSNAITAAATMTPTTRYHGRFLRKEAHGLSGGSSELPSLIGTELVASWALFQVAPTYDAFQVSSVCRRVPPPSI